MKTTESCTLCEKIVMTITSRAALASRQDLPNTFDQRSKRFAWRHTDLLAYALVPRSFEGTTGSVDCYLCVEEDDLDDVDLLEYAETVLKEMFKKRWSNIRDIHLLPPSLAAADDLACWKLRHESEEGLR